MVPADFVTIDTGTGVVHQAPAFGEVDYEMLVAEQARFRRGEGPELLCSVAPDGKFTAEAPDYAGRWVKDADKDICRELRRRGLLYHQEQYLHDYPFCWRADEDPLIQYPRRSWFIRTTQFKDRMLANNRQINWLPEHIRDGRFGNFLETNVDWALSRERYWGTPLPIWVCEKTGKMEAVASYDELLAKPGVRGVEVWEAAKERQAALPDDLRVHKPYIDAMTYDSPVCRGRPDAARAGGDRLLVRLRRDAVRPMGLPAQRPARSSRAVPRRFHQRGPRPDPRLVLQPAGHQHAAVRRRRSSPIRGAAPRPFPHPFRNCIVLGLMLGEDGGKMSKSKRNYREPKEIFDRYGADALRWYFFANQPPWTSIRYSEAAIRDSIPEFLLRLWNVYSFFVIYANIDGFAPGGIASPASADQLTPADAGPRPRYRPVSQRERTGPLDLERAEPHDRRRHRAHGRLRQLSRPARASASSSTR